MPMLNSPILDQLFTIGATTLTIGEWVAKAFAIKDRVVSLIEVGLTPLEALEKEADGDFWGKYWQAAMKPAREQLFDITYDDDSVKTFALLGLVLPRIFNVHPAHSFDGSRSPVEVATEYTDRLRRHQFSVDVTGPLPAATEFFTGCAQLWDRLKHDWTAPTALWDSLADEHRTSQARSAFEKAVSCTLDIKGVDILRQLARSGPLAATENGTSAVAAK